MSVRGVITSRAFFSENSNTPSSSVASCVCEHAALLALLDENAQLVRRVERFLERSAASAPNARSTSLADDC